MKNVLISDGNDSSKEIQETTYANTTVAKLFLDDLAKKENLLNCGTQNKQALRKDINETGKLTFLNHLSTSD